jgi:hypothetical protein
MADVVAGIPRPVGLLVSAEAGTASQTASRHTTNLKHTGMDDTPPGSASDRKAIDKCKLEIIAH